MIRIVREGSAVEAPFLSFKQPDKQDTPQTHADTAEQSGKTTVIYSSHDRVATICCATC